MRSSTTEDDEREMTSRNSSVCAPRFTVLMLGAQEVGKTTLTSHFMTSCNNGAYGNTDSFGKSTLHIDTLILFNFENCLPFLKY